MEENIKCSVCHTIVKPTDYFCFNCGNNLKPKPPSTTPISQIIVYLESLLLPPYGIILGLRYLRSKEGKIKVVGVIAIVLTVISLIVVTKLTLDLIDKINTQVNSQMMQLGTF